jgi:hypothetical protein
MLRLLADENFHGDIVRGVRLRRPQIDLVRAQDAELSGRDDPSILAWAAANNRIVLTHDRATMARYAYERITVGEEMVGVFVFDPKMTVGEAIEELLLFESCSEHSEWTGRVAYVPF